MADSAQLRFKAACERFGIPCRREGDHFVITDEDVEREVVVFPATDEQARTEVVIEDTFYGPHLKPYTPFVLRDFGRVAWLFTNQVRDVRHVRTRRRRMARRVVVGDLRVQQIDRRDGRRSWTIVWPEGTEHTEADRFLRRHEGSGTQRTYAYVLVDHLRWLERECLTLDRVVLRDLERYMGTLGAQVRMPLGQPWRVDKRPYGPAALSITASCLKGFYLHQAALGINPELGNSLSQTRLPSRLDRRRSFLGHTTTSLLANPLAPHGPVRRHPKMLPDGARDKLLQAVNSARDRLVVTWLVDGGLRIGELCGLHLVDLHLREDAACGQCRTPHVHVCHRPNNPNGAEAKTKHPWRTEHGTVTGGLVKRVSPAMIHTYFDYITTEYPLGSTDHGMLLIQLHGDNVGQPWAPVAARRMLARAGTRAGVGVVKPHAFRHSFTSAVLDASQGNLLIARDAADRPDLRFHDLRHSGAVLAAATGATLAELMARLGHSTPAAAMRYQHAAQGRDQDIAVALSKIALG